MDQAQNTGGEAIAVLAQIAHRRGMRRSPSIETTANWSTLVNAIGNISTPEKAYSLFKRLRESYNIVVRHGSMNPDEDYGPEAIIINPFVRSEAVPNTHGVCRMLQGKVQQAVSSLADRSPELFRIEDIPLKPTESEQKVIDNVKLIDSVFDFIRVRQQIADEQVTFTIDGVPDIQLGNVPQHKMKFAIAIKRELERVLKPAEGQAIEDSLLWKILAHHGGLLAEDGLI